MDWSTIQDRWNEYRHAAKRRTAERLGAATMSPASKMRLTKLPRADVYRDPVGPRVLC